MRQMTLLLTAVLLNGVARPAVGADDESLRKATVAWLKSKTTEKQDEDSLIKALSEPVEKITAAGHNFTFTLGSEMTRSGKPVMVCGWAGELFPFDLTEGQAKSLSLKTTGVTFNANRRYGKPAEKPVVILSELKITEADSLDGGKPIKGTVKVKVSAPLKDAENLRFRLDLKFPGFTRTKFFTIKTAPADGTTLAFTFSEINPPGGKYRPSRGPVGAFLNLVGGPEDDETKLVLFSNTLGALLDVE